MRLWSPSSKYKLFKLLFCRVLRDLRRPNFRHHHVQLLQELLGEHVRPPLLPLAKGAVLRVPPQGRQCQGKVILGHVQEGEDLFHLWLWVAAQVLVEDGGVVDVLEIELVKFVVSFFLVLSAGREVLFAKELLFHSSLAKHTHQNPRCSDSTTLPHLSPRWIDILTLWSRYCATDPA